MKNIKSFKQFESNNDDDILSLLIFLEESSKKLDDKSHEWNSVGINYKELQNNRIDVEYYWSCPEEGGDSKFIIDLNNFSVRELEKASTVYGSYENDNNRKFNNISEIIEHLEKCFGLKD